MDVQQRFSSPNTIDNLEGLLRHNTRKINFLDALISGFIKNTRPKSEFLSCQTPLFYPTMIRPSACPESDPPYRAESSAINQTSIGGRKLPHVPSLSCGSKIFFRGPLAAIRAATLGGLGSPSPEVPSPLNSVVLRSSEVLHQPRRSPVASIAVCCCPPGIGVSGPPPSALPFSGAPGAPISAGVFTVVPPSLLHRYHTASTSVLQRTVLRLILGPLDIASSSLGCPVNLFTIAKLPFHGVHCQRQFPILFAGVWFLQITVMGRTLTLVNSQSWSKSCNLVNMSMLVNSGHYLNRRQQALAGIRLTLVN